MRAKVGNVSYDSSRLNIMDYFQITVLSSGLELHEFESTFKANEFDESSIFSTGLSRWKLHLFQIMFLYYKHRFKHPIGTKLTYVFSSVISGLELVTSICTSLICALLGGGDPCTKNGMQSFVGLDCWTTS